MVEVAEFPHLFIHYNIGGMLKVVTNRVVEFESAFPEKYYLEKVLGVDEKAQF